MPAKPASAACLGVGLAAVNDEWLAELLGEREVRLEKAALVGGLGEVMEAVEPGLPHRDRLRVGEQRAQLVQPPRLGGGRLVRVDPERRVDAVVRPGERERCPARLDPGPDGHDARHPRRTRSGGERLCRLRARVEVRVRVDHDAAVGGRCAGRAARPPRCRKRRPRGPAGLVPPTSAGWQRARIRAAVFDEAASATATPRRPSARS